MLFWGVTRISVCDVGLMTSVCDVAVMELVRLSPDRMDRLGNK